MHVEIDRVPERRRPERDRSTDIQQGAPRRPRGRRGLEQDARPGRWRSSTDLARATRRRCPPRRSSEGAELLEWLADDHFTFLGYREYRLEEPTTATTVLRAVPGTGLGHPARRPGHVGVVRQAARRWSSAKAREKTLLVLAKANSRATVHRPAYLDYVGVKTFDENGEVVGERRFLGLFSSRRLHRVADPDPGDPGEGPAGHRAAPASTR